MNKKLCLLAQVKRLSLKDLVLPSMYVYTILHVYYPLDNHSPSSNNNNNTFRDKQ